MNVKIVTKTQFNYNTGAKEEYEVFQISAGDDSFYIMPDSFEYNGLQAVTEAAV